MNFLAHFHIAQQTQTSYAGALLGDMVKGSAYRSLSDELAVAIQLHRRIDSYTDSAPQLLALHQQFAQGERRFVGIVIDILFDHLLACHWQHYSKIELPIFSSHVYQQLLALPENIWPSYHELAQRMQRYKWLESYADSQTLPIIFERLQQRLSRPVNLSKIAEPLMANKAMLLSVFDDFYPKLLTQSQHWANELQTNYGSR